MRDSAPLLGGSGGGARSGDAAGAQHHGSSAADDHATASKHKTGVWGARDRGCLGSYNDVVSRFPSFQILLCTLVSVAILAVLWDLADGESKKEAVLTSFLGSAAVETMLSLDNLVVFHQIFISFKVPASRRPGILLAGIPVMIAVRVTLFMSFHGIYTYMRIVFGAIGLFIMYQAVCVLYFGDDGDDDPDLASHWFIQGFKACLGKRLSTRYEGSSFWGKDAMTSAVYFTPMLLVMMAIEVADVMFCIDGVSTIYVVGHDNLHAVILGDHCAAFLVRALYPMLQGTVDLFPDLNYSVAATLAAVGVDMIASAFGKEFPVYTLVTFMVGAFTLGIVSSLTRGICVRRDDPKPNDVDDNNV